MKKTIFKIIYIVLISLSVIACGTEDEFSESIFDTTVSEDSSLASYEFDNWLKDSYLIPYNLDFRYRMQDVGSDLDYNLVPVSFTKAQQMAKIVKYLWFDAYDKIVGPDFLKENGPRIIHLIGSPAYNPTSGTMLLGTAEGGLKVTLYRCNELDPSNIDQLNEYYFKTMHHEFAHILHQKRNYPVEFGLISVGNYSPLGWQNKTDSEAASMGFVSPYASSQKREDFVEIIANYLVKTDEQWARILAMADKPGKDYSGAILPDDGIDGEELIGQKLEIAKKWLIDSWGIDLEALKNEIQTRESHINDIIN